jgi:hypothetical protein
MYLETWPDSFPPGCPPPDAVVATGSFYRLVRSDPPTEEDFESHYERHLAGRMRRFWDDDIKAAGISVFADKEDAEKSRAAIPALKNSKVALGNIDNSGRMQHTPGRSGESHHTWWRPENDEAWKGFEVVS